MWNANNKMIPKHIQTLKSQISLSNKLGSFLLSRKISFDRNRFVHSLTKSKNFNFGDLNNIVFSKIQELDAFLNLKTRSSLVMTIMHSFGHLDYSESSEDTSYLSIGFPNKAHFVFDTLLLRTRYNSTSNLRLFNMCMTKVKNSYNPENLHLDSEFSFLVQNYLVLHFISNIFGSKNKIVNSYIYTVKQLIVKNHRNQVVDLSSFVEVVYRSLDLDNTYSSHDYSKSQKQVIRKRLLSISNNKKMWKTIIQTVDQKPGNYRVVIGKLLQNTLTHQLS